MSQLRLRLRLPRFLQPQQESWQETQQARPQLPQILHIAVRCPLKCTAAANPDYALLHAETILECAANVRSPSSACHTAPGFPPAASGLAARPRPESVLRS